MIWQRSHLLTLNIYRISKKFPKVESMALTYQIGKAAYSIPTNIAGGCERKTTPQLKSFLNIAAGSAAELHYQLILFKDLLYLPRAISEELIQEILEIKK
ncbi:four helix bundle protein [Niabella ginsenosidivorans]|uniref:four helix bundle protein n=1 Tax=Niabella ginsenosidivorans TaxID=1176587 RepID=UPI001C54E864|nr:four helix bundle protein [Niabella ginsenosidivorans]